MLQVLTLHHSPTQHVTLLHVTMIITLTGAELLHVVTVTLIRLHWVLTLHIMLQVTLTVTTAIAETTMLTDLLILTSAMPLTH